MSEMYDANGVGLITGLGPEDRGEIDDRCPRCAPLGCDCSDSERPGYGEYDANILPSGRRCHCGAHAAGGDCMCYEYD